MVNAVAKYQKYAEYKESGVEWLGEIPSHWDGVPCRSVVEHIVEKNTNNSSDNYLSLMANIGVIRYEDKGDIGNKKPEDLSKCKIVKKGQLVINSMNYSIGSFGMSSYDGICSPVYIVLQSKINVYLERFALRVFENSSFQKYLAKFGNGILEHRSAINWDDIKDKYIPLPSLKEQKSILLFLDYETAKIDSLIEKQQKLIELLKEKRQVVISHAVTKGLNPNVPMKDSGVEWLGQVPEHWGITKLKWKALTTSGSTPTTSKYELYYENGNIPWIRTTDLNNSDLYETPISITSKAVNDTACSILPINSILIAMYGGAGSIGKHALLKFESTINQAVCGVLPSKYFNSDYLHRFYEFYRPFWMIGAMGTRKDPNIGQDHIKEATVLLPPLEEQEKIAKYILDIQIAYDNLTNRAEAAIQLMQERRTALISAAVTGKIDVRNWQNPNNNNEAKMEFSA